MHKLIRLGEDYEDASETDITYAYGARDVENKTYRWGCSISSPSISFVYGPGDSNYDTEKKTGNLGAVSEIHLHAFDGEDS